MMTTIDKNKPVLVTGATGFIAGWLVKKLLNEGITVHAAVRDLDNKKKVAHLDQIAAQSPGSIQYFKSDLLEEGSYAEAMAGCELVFHTASPYVLSAKNPQKDLVEPALKGTQNVLQEANKSATVKRVVLTSSCAAIYCDAAEMKEYPNGMITEEIWNTNASLDYQPYSYSKTLAEKEAWKISEAQNKWDLVVINPSAVFGPSLNPHSGAESINLLKQFGDGTLKAGVPKISIGIVDVRDLADAHFKAGFTPEAKGRNIISAHNSNFFDLAQIMYKKYGDKYPLPKTTAPKWLLMLIGPFINKALTRKYIKNNVGMDWKADNSKGIRELGVQYRPLEETMLDSFQMLIDAKLIPTK